MGLALVAEPSVHGGVTRTYLIYVRRSYKEATAADVSDELQVAACRALLPAGAPVRVISPTRAGITRAPAPIGTATGHSWPRSRRARWRASRCTTSHVWHGTRS